MLLLYTLIVRATWEDTGNRIVAFIKSTDQGFWILSIIIGQLDFTDLDIIRIPICWVLFQGRRRFRSDGLDQIRTAVEDTRWRSPLTIVISFRFQEFFVNRHQDPHRSLRIPETFRLAQGILNGIIINSLYSYSWEIRCFPWNIIIQAFDRFLNQVNRLWFLVCRVLETCDKVLGFDFSIFFPFRSHPFDPFTEFISIGQAILGNRPVFSKRWDQVPVLVHF